VLPQAFYLVGSLSARPCTDKHMGKMKKNVRTVIYLQNRILGPFVSRLYLIVVFYGIPTSHALGKRSSDGNGNESLSAGETASLVVGIIGVLLTGITVFKGLQCWRLRRVSGCCRHSCSYTRKCLQIDFRRSYQTQLLRISSTITHRPCHICLP